MDFPHEYAPEGGHTRGATNRSRRGCSPSTLEEGTRERTTNGINCSPVVCSEALLRSEATARTRRYLGRLLRTRTRSRGPRVPTPYPYGLSRGPRDGAHASAGRSRDIRTCRGYSQHPATRRQVGFEWVPNPNLDHLTSCGKYRSRVGSQPEPRPPALRHSRTPYRNVRSARGLSGPPSSNTTNTSLSREGGHEASMPTSIPGAESELELPVTFRPDGFRVTNSGTAVLARFPLVGATTL